MSSPRVAVVIPCFNHGRYLRETVESVLAQTFESLEVVVVDDGSTDDSAEVAEALRAENPERVRLLRQPNSGHPAFARNNGIRATSGEYVLCLDADDQLPPDWLAACVEALDSRPDAGVAYTDQQDFGASDRYHSVAEYDFRGQAHKNWFGICSLFRRAAWEAVGGWDPEIALSEDWDFWIGCGYHGFPAVKVHGVAWLYRTSDDGRYAMTDMDNDRYVKAQLVLKRPELYTPVQHEWARGVLDGDPAALSVRHEFGIIPGNPILPENPPVERPDVRAFATVALAEELAVRPELLEAYARAFGEEDDATLVIYAAGSDEQAVVEQLTPLLARTGLDGDGAPDMLAYPAPVGLGDSVLAARAGAVLSCFPPEGPLAALPRFDDKSIEALGRLARESRA
jgi:glycosyltransferase involved in cell wall biosynthesis